MRQPVMSIAATAPTWPARTTLAGPMFWDTCPIAYSKTTYTYIHTYIHTYIDYIHIYIHMVVCSSISPQSGVIRCVCAAMLPSDCLLGKILHCLYVCICACVCMYVHHVCMCISVSTYLICKYIVYVIIMRPIL